MRSVFILSLTAVALSACSDNQAEEKSGAEVAQAAKALAKPRPGLYTSKTKVLEVMMPGLPAAQAAQIKQAMSSGAEGTQTSCLTKADADKGFEDMVQKIGSGQDGMKCTFSQFDVAGSNLDAKLSCQGPEGVNASLVIDGTIESEKSAMKMSMTSKSPMMPGGEMKVVMQIDSVRTGDCAS